jgi:mono/diheme cytochrome c family protein
MSISARSSSRTLELGRGFAALLALTLPLLGSAEAETRPAARDLPRLAFRAPGRSVVELDLDTLRRACGAHDVEVDDPYQGRRVRYRALPMACVLDQGFADRGGVASLANEGLLLRARDGYTRPASGADLADPHAQLAFGETALGDDAAGRPRFSPIDRRQVDPAPFYLVWTDARRGDPHAHPWPYQLVTIEIAGFEEAFPHTVPRDLPGSDPGWRGYALFQASCSACHAINGEGGKVGPDLNVPLSIVEYRPESQIRAYIRDPQAIRYTSMPAHPGLGEADLDALIAYFTAMSRRKHDPRPGAGS